MNTGLFSKLEFIHQIKAIFVSNASHRNIFIHTLSCSSRPPWVLKASCNVYMAQRFIQCTSHNIVNENSINKTPNYDLKVVQKNSLERVVMATICFAAQANSNNAKSHTQ